MYVEYGWITADMVGKKLNRNVATTSDDGRSKREVVADRKDIVPIQATGSGVADSGRSRSEKGDRK